MQSNIKGFLCSLIYQILSQDISSALPLLESKSVITRESSTADWDPMELQRILINLTHQPGKAFCIFIDGLDGLSPEESPRDLIDIIKDLQGPQVKLCLSSRPEPAMKMYLGHYPTLPMHIFTRDDIKQYAEGILTRAISHNNNFSGVDRLVAQVLSEADGVFLWVVLVSRSLERGIEKGDSLQILEERLRQIPKSLSELYSSMWQRCEDDPEIYQNGFSQFMNLMILAENITCLAHVGRVTVFELMAATNTSFLDKYLNQDDGISKEELELLCRDTRNSIEVWSAGLLMVRLVAITPFEKNKDSGPYDDLEFYSKMTVGFVHRTARDFLLDEVEGQKLWKRVNVSRQDLQAKLVKAAVMVCQLWRAGDESLRYVERFFDSITRSEGSQEAAYVQKHTLPDIEKAFYKQYLRLLFIRKLHKYQGLKVNFLEVAADYGFCDYIFNRIQELRQTGQLTAQDYASLLYAYCNRRAGQNRGEAVFVARERLIQSLLSSGLPSLATTRFSTDFNLGRNLLLAYLVSNLEGYPNLPMMGEGVTTLALLWKQAPSVQNVHVQLVVSFSNLGVDDQTLIALRLGTNRSLYDKHDALVVMRVNVPYLVMAIGSLVDPSLCIPGILSGEEKPSAQAIHIGVHNKALYIPDYYEIESEGDSRKIMECITPLLHCNHGSGPQKQGCIKATEWRILEKILQQMVSKAKPLSDEVDRDLDEKTSFRGVEDAADELLGDIVTKLSLPWFTNFPLQQSTGPTSFRRIEGRREYGAIELRQATVHRSFAGVLTNE